MKKSPSKKLTKADKRWILMLIIGFVLPLLVSIGLLIWVLSL